MYIHTCTVSNLTGYLKVFSLANFKSEKGLVSGEVIASEGLSSGYGVL